MVEGLPPPVDGLLGAEACPYTLSHAAEAFDSKEDLASHFLDEPSICHQPSSLPGFLHHKKALLHGSPGPMHRRPDGPAELVVSAVDVW
jgi:hypothetical protein